MTSIKISIATLFSFIVLITVQSSIFAQSGKRIEQPSPTPVSIETEVKASVAKDLENVRFIVANNMPNYASEINNLGKLGYRVQNAFNFGGDASSGQSFAALLKLETGNTYEYEWLTSPNKNFLESRLNGRSESGFFPVHVFAITQCGGDEDTDLDPGKIFSSAKGDIFLLERKNGLKQKSKDYKVFVGKIGVGKSPTKELQASLDSTSKEYRPFKILFAKTGMLDFSVSIVLEKDLNDPVESTTLYKFVKEVNGFEKEISTLAQSGYRFLSGRRIGMIKYALMAKNTDSPTSYIFVDENKYVKELAKSGKPSDEYRANFTGDSTCDSNSKTGGKLVFERRPDSSLELDHKYIQLNGKISDTNAGIIEIKKLVSQNYQVLDVFYSEGVTVILAK